MAGKRKPYVDKSGQTCEKERHLSSQPLKYNKYFNMRKLMELPIHLVNAGQLDMLKKELISNLEWLTNKMLATSVRSVDVHCRIVQNYFFTYS